MKLKILLPFQVFADLDGVMRIVAQTAQGSFGLLPHRLDCVAALAPGILFYQSEAAGEVYLAIDEGILIKTGTEVLVSVRRATGGADLEQLHATVAREFLSLDEQEQSQRALMMKLENGFLRRLASFHDEY
ncbi:MAG: F0F1 ATP synthase subunit epsilon [Pseudomonadales bacterium]|nr:F0F1 ATP synthase subunit epsilon [Pseudomonadales bacterium]